MPENEEHQQPAAETPSETPSGTPPATPSEPSPPSPRSGVVEYVPLGWRGMVPILRSRRTVRIDFDRRVISRGGAAIPFDRVRVADVHVGIFGVSDGSRWICFDSHAYGDREGVLSLADGRLSMSFSRDLLDLQRAISTERPDAPVPEPAHEFRYGIRVEIGTIVFSVVVLGIFFGYYYNQRGGQLEDVVDTGALRIFGMALIGALAWLVFWRRSSRVRFDESGIDQRRAFFFRRRCPWREVDGLRMQGLEIEIEGPRFRLPLNLDILSCGGGPVLFRRGIRRVLSPPGARFLAWLRTKAEERPERSIFGSALERTVGRLWVLVIVVANAWVFYLSEPPAIGGEPRFFDRRLEELGARTPDSFEEPWRFFTSLFLHGDLLHIGQNMLVLAAVAPWMVRIFGVVRSTVLYLGSGVVGNALAQLAPLIFGGEPPELSVGASTALMGIIGSLLGAVYRRRLSVPLAVRARFRWAIPVMVLLTIGLGLTVPFIDDAAHLGGFIAGLGLVWVVPPPGRRRGGGEGGGAVG